MNSKGYRPKKELTMGQKLAGTALCVVFYRLLSFIPLPFVDSSYIRAAIGANGSLGLLNMLSGGGLGNMSVTALGIGPWITASIVLQLLGTAFPSIADMKKDADGKKKQRLITFAIAGAMALMESIGLLLGFGRQGVLADGYIAVIVPAVIMMAGAGLLSLMGWLIDERLFGNGTSIILTAGILCSYVSDGTILGLALAGDGGPWALAISYAADAALFILVFGFTVFISSCKKTIKVVHSKSGRKLSPGGQTGGIPIKLISGGVMPVIFASTIITFPALLSSMFGLDWSWLKIFDTSCWLDSAYPWASMGLVLYGALIIWFGYFCQVIYLNPMEIADNLKTQGAVVPGVRPGVPTAEYITRQMKWFTALGGIFLCIVVAVPMAVSSMAHVPSLSFLGTSVLITVSVLDESWAAWKAGGLSKERSAKGIL